MTIRDAIRFYEQHGRMPFPISGGSGEGEQKEGEGKEGESKEGGESKEETPKTFTQADVDRLIGERLKREKSSLRTEILKEIEGKQKEADDIAKGNFDKVIGERDAEITRLNGLLGNLEEFERIARERHEKLVKDLPEPIKLLMPDDMQPLDFEKWYAAKAAPALEKYEKEKGKKGNNPKDPEPGGDQSEVEKLIENQKRKMKESGSYRV